MREVGEQGWGQDQEVWGDKEIMMVMMMKRTRSETAVSLFVLQPRNSSSPFYKKGERIVSSRFDQSSSLFWFKMHCSQAYKRNHLVHHLTCESQLIAKFLKKDRFLLGGRIHGIVCVRNWGGPSYHCRLHFNHCHDNYIIVIVFIILITRMKSALVGMTFTEIHELLHFNHYRVSHQSTPP